MLFLLEGMLNVDVAERWEADTLMSALRSHELDVALMEGPSKQQSNGCSTPQRLENKTFTAPCGKVDDSASRRRGVKFLTA